MPDQPKTLRIVRVVTTVTDVDLSSYFDFQPGGLSSETPAKRYWTAEEAIAYERSRGDADKYEAFELALVSGEMTAFVQGYDVVTDLPRSTSAPVSDTERVDARTDTEREADEQSAQAKYEANARAGLLGT